MPKFCGPGANANPMKHSGYITRGYMASGPKRRIKRNPWGNIVAYLGTRRVWDFGLSDMDAREWVQRGEWLAGYGDAGDFLCSVTMEGELVKRPAPDGYIWTPPEKTSVS